MKALLNYVKAEDPVFSNPFTLVDPQGSVWAIATDRVWFVAAKNKNSCPRFRGDASALNVFLRLLRMEPKDAVAFDREQLLRRLDPEGLGSVLGVVVSMKRLYDLLSFPAAKVHAWNASDALSSPALGFSGEDWKAYLMGFEGVTGTVPELTLDVTKSLFDEIMSLED